MLDIKYIRENPEQTKEKSKQKGYDVDVDKLIAIDDERRKLLNQIENIRKQRNQLTAENKGQRPSDEDVYKRQPYMYAMN